MMVWWPGHWDGGKERDQIAMIFDIYPTILAALGIQTPEKLDGTDLFAPVSDRELRWYSNNMGVDSFGVLSRDGQWRLDSWADIKVQLHHESDLIESQPVNRLQEQPEIALAMQESMRDWIRSVTRVDNLSQVEEGGWTSYSGAAFRRTPLGGTHSMGFVFQRGASEDPSVGRQQLVSQEGYIDISEADNSLRIRIDGNELEVGLPTGQQCFSVVISSAMIKTNMVFYRKGALSQTTVYLDGEPVAVSPYQNPVLNKASPTTPLKVHSFPASRWYMPSTAQVFISTRAVGAEEVVEVLNSELRAGCDEKVIGLDR